MNEMCEKAVEKLRQEMKANKNEYDKRVIDYLIGRCKEDAGLCEDVLKDNKNHKDCWRYIRDNAKKEAVLGCACIADGDVFEWAEDYYHSVDPDKKVTEKKTKPKKADVTEKKTKEPVKVEKKAAEKKPKPKQKNKVEDYADGQLSLFDLMGGGMIEA